MHRCEYNIAFYKKKILSKHYILCKSVKQPDLLFLRVCCLSDSLYCVILFNRCTLLILVFIGQTLRLHCGSIEIMGKNLCILLFPLSGKSLKTMWIIA